MDEPRADERLTGTVLHREVACEAREVPNADRVMSFVASTEEVARDGDIIRASGWMLDEFKRNPVIMLGHGYNSDLPIGRAVRVEKMKDPPRLEVDIQFAGDREAHPLAETVFRLYQAGFMRALSVGWITRAYEKPTDEERVKQGLGPFGVVITAAELLEVSAVPVPADPGAVKIEGGPRLAHLTYPLTYPPDPRRDILREDIVRMRNAAPPGDRDRWEALLGGDVRAQDPGVPSGDAASFEEFREEVSSRFDELHAEIRALRDDLRLRALEAETPPDSARDEPAVDWYGIEEALRGHINPNQGGTHCPKSK